MRRVPLEPRSSGALPRGFLTLMIALALFAGLAGGALATLIGDHDEARAAPPLPVTQVPLNQLTLAPLVERVAPGGVAALHVCIDRGDSPAQALRYLAQRHVPGVHRYLNRRAGRPADEPLMQMNAYPLPAILAQAQALGFGASLAQPEAHGRFLTAQLLMRREGEGTQGQGAATS